MANNNQHAEVLRQREDNEKAASRVGEKRKATGQVEAGHGPEVLQQARANLQAVTQLHDVLTEVFNKLLPLVTSSSDTASDDVEDLGHALHAQALNVLEYTDSFARTGEKTLNSCTIVQADHLVTGRSVFEWKEVDRLLSQNGAVLRSEYTSWHCFEQLKSKDDELQQCKAELEAMRSEMRRKPESSVLHRQRYREPCGELDVALRERAATKGRFQFRTSPGLEENLNFGGSISENDDESGETVVEGFGSGKLVSDLESEKADSSHSDAPLPNKQKTPGFGATERSVLRPFSSAMTRKRPQRQSESPQVRSAASSTVRQAQDTRTQRNVQELGYAKGVVPMRHGVQRAAPKKTVSSTVPAKRKQGEVELEQVGYATHQASPWVYL